MSNQPLTPEQVAHLEDLTKRFPKLCIATPANSADASKWARDGYLYVEVDGLDQMEWLVKVHDFLPRLLSWSRELTDAVAVSVVDGRARERDILGRYDRAVADNAVLLRSLTEAVRELKSYQDPEEDLTAMQSVLAAEHPGQAIHDVLHAAEHAANMWTEILPEGSNRRENAMNALVKAVEVWTTTPKSD